MSWGHLIREIGRGAHGSRDLDVEQASLLFGAIVAAAAAMSARWEDDRITFGWPRREPE